MKKETQGVWTLIVGGVLAVAAVAALFIAPRDNPVGPQESKEEKILRKARDSEDVTPKGKGPWPYAVVRTQGIGLKVRNGNTAEGEQIGLLIPLASAWGICKTDSGFDPDPPTGNGPIWMKIKWNAPSPGLMYGNQSRLESLKVGHTEATLHPLGIMARSLPARFLRLIPTSYEVGTRL